MSSTLQEKETSPLSQVEKQITEHVLLSTSQTPFFEVQRSGYFTKLRNLSVCLPLISSSVTSYAFRIKSNLLFMTIEPLHPPVFSYQPGPSPTTFLPPSLPVPHPLYSSNTQLPIVPEDAMCSPIPEPLHLMFSLLRIPSPACPPGKPTFK